MNILLTWIIVVCVSSTISGELELKLINVVSKLIMSSDSENKNI